MAEPSPRDAVTVVSNNKAIGAWLFMAVWMGMLAVFTDLARREGGIPGMGALGFVLLGAFWLAGVSASSWAFSLPRIRVTVAGGEVVTRQSWLWGRREHRFAAADIAVPDVIAGTDSEGDAYYSCRLTLPGGIALDVAGSSDRPEVEAVRQRLAAALRGP